MRTDLSKFVKLLVVFLVLFPRWLFAAADSLELSADYDGDETKAYSYSVPKHRFENTPSWKAQKEPIPLSVDAALRIALKWLEVQPWRDSVYVRHISLTRVYHIYPDKWYYSILLDERRTDESTPEGGVFRVKHPAGIVVLLDGTLVEPADVRAVKVK